MKPAAFVASRERGQVVGRLEVKGFGQSNIHGAGILGRVGRNAKGAGAGRNPNDE
jgi:hypothetical protein